MPGMQRAIEKAIGRSLTREEKKAVKLVNAVQKANQRLSLAAGDWTTQENTTDELSLIAEYQAERPLALRAGVELDIHIVAYEEFTSNTGDSAQDTYSLANNIIDADAVADPLVLYQGGSAVDEDSIDFGANTFDYTDDGSGDPVDAYYIVADQALVDIRKVAPKNVNETMKELDAGIANRRDQREDGIMFHPSHPLQGVVPTDWTIEVQIDAPYNVQFSGDNQASNPDNMLLDLPIARGRDEISNLEDVVKAAI